MFDWSDAKTAPDPRMKFKEIHEVKTVLKRGLSQIARVVSKFTYEDSSLDEVMDTRTVVTDGYSAYWLVGDVGAVQVDHTSPSKMDQRQSNTRVDDRPCASSRWLTEFGAVASDGGATRSSLVEVLGPAILTEVGRANL